MRQPSLLIFDCDGVLIDSQAIQCHVDAAELTRYGYPISPEALGRRFFGVATKQMQAEIERELGRTLPANFEARRNDLVEAAYRQKLKEISGVRESLEKIDLPVCVASNAATNRIQQVLGLTGLLSLFEPHLFGADLVPRPKPFPDLFLLAAERMGVPPFVVSLSKTASPGFKLQSGLVCRYWDFMVEATASRDTRGTCWRQEQQQCSAICVSFP
jgi:beta-phosphoglucomutase-like phosphatase (HAD superfamily)